MNQLVQASPLDQYRTQVLPPERAKELWTSLPSHIKPAVFERNLTNALMANPDLMKFDARLIFREVAKAAALGLLLDPLLGEGYLVPAYNYKTKRVEPQLRVGYKGMCKLARQTGNVKNIYVHEVCAADKVTCDFGYPKVLHIEPKLFTDRGPIIGYVAVIVYKDDAFDFEPMSVDECLRIRDRSDAWKAFSEGKIKSTPWATDEAEMSKKTTVRRLMKRQDQSPELVRAFQIEDEAEQIADTLPDMPRIGRVPSPTEVEEGPHGSDKYLPGDIVQVTGDIQPPKPDETKSSPIPKPKEDVSLIQSDYEGWIAWVIKRMKEIEDGGELETFWKKEVERIASEIMPPDYTDLLERYDLRQAEMKEGRQ